MAVKKSKDGKGAFVRVCAGCGKHFIKSNLFRVARTESGVFVDSSGKSPGRGAYVCRNIGCVAAAKKNNRIARTLKTRIPDGIYESLAAAVNEVTDCAGS